MTKYKLFQIFFFFWLVSESLGCEAVAAANDDVMLDPSDATSISELWLDASNDAGNM
jgi:hypothetical protein